VGLGERGGEDQVAGMAGAVDGACRDGHPGSCNVDPSCFELPVDPTSDWFASRPTRWRLGWCLNSSTLNRRVRTSVVPALA
jgi:hypothetical protein